MCAHAAREYGLICGPGVPVWPSAARVAGVVRVTRVARAARMARVARVVCAARLARVARKARKARKAREAWSADWTAVAARVGSNTAGRKRERLQREVVCWHHRRDCGPHGIWAVCGIQVYKSPTTCWWDSNRWSTASFPKLNLEKWARPLGDCNCQRRFEVRSSNASGI